MADMKCEYCNHTVHHSFGQTLVGATATKPPRRVWLCECCAYGYMGACSAQPAKANR